MSRYRWVQPNLFFHILGNILTLLVFSQGDLERENPCVFLTVHDMGSNQVEEKIIAKNHVGEKSLQKNQVEEKSLQKNLGFYNGNAKKNGNATVLTAKYIKCNQNQLRSQWLSLLSNQQ